MHYMESLELYTDVFLLPPFYIFLVGAVSWHCNIYIYIYICTFPYTLKMHVFLLYVFPEPTTILLRKLKGGDKDLLEKYSNCQKVEEVLKVEREYLAAANDKDNEDIGIWITGGTCATSIFLEPVPAIRNPDPHSYPQVPYSATR
ncbi:hypothetical protein XELAEV_18047530mg [Xenopus laevis]|uniref:Uncharacterized protein n=1 Tax=Xenopus laevis TaxID=8355 RepID=A0A974H1M7_XENLA|nr:hypothetical protein XELAEV_18047530mg [Xenopus laevis]